MQKHDRLVLLLSRKMRLDGFKIVAYEGKRLPGFPEELPMPIIRHRPDIIGITRGKIAIGEAKTASDLNSRRTREQILDFYNAKTKSGNSMLVYIAITKEARSKLESILDRFSLIQKTRIKILEVPELLLNGPKI